MKNVWVFTTSVETPLGVSALAPYLDRLAGRGRWNFDLDDCDRILRVAADCQQEEIIGLLESCGYRCAELADEVPASEWIEDSRMAS